MRIEINEVWAIDFDGTSYMPVKKTIVTAKDSVRKGEVNETVRGYFSQLGNAVNSIIQTDMGNSNQTLTLPEYVNQYKAIKEDLLKKLEITA